MRPEPTRVEKSLAAIPAWRRMLYALLAVAFSLLGLAVSAEIVLRLLPVNEGLRTQSVNATNPVYRFEPNRVSTWSRGWNFSISNEVRVNNDGFVNNQDYVIEGQRPLMAVVGDSYIEAAMVPFRETTHGRLAESVGGRGRVYSFAASGAGLSQYLVWAAYARNTYKPDVFVFLHISNDLSESLIHRGRSPGFHHFERLPENKALVRRIDYEPTLIRKLARYSVLAMYLITNLKIESVLKWDLQYFGAQDKRWTANIEDEAPEQEYNDYQWAVRSFLDALPEATGLPAERVVIAIDGVREAIYDPSKKEQVAKSVWGKMRKYMAEQAQSRGFLVIDMHPKFEKSYAQDGRRFEFPTDTHWNGHGHALLAEAITQTKLFDKLYHGAK